MERFEKTTTGITKVISQDALIHLGNVTLNDLSERDMGAVMKHYLLNTLTEQLGHEVKKAQTNINELIETWLSTLNSDITRLNYRHNIDEFIAWLGGRCPLDVKSIDADHYLIHLKNRKLKDGSIRFKIAAVSSFFSFLTRHDVVRQNYFHRIKLPKKQMEIRKESDVPTTEEIHCIEEELYNNLHARGRGSVGKARASQVMLVAISFMTTTANRVGSLPSLRIDTKGYYTCRSKGSNIRGSIQQSTMELMHRFGLDPQTPFKDIKVSAVKKYFELVMTKLYREGKIRKVFTPHSLKHFAAINFWESCKDIYKLKEFLHHKSISTSQIYLASLGLDQ